MRMPLPSHQISPSFNFDLRSIARALGGEIVGRDSVLARGPGHSPKDRSLKVSFKSDGSFSVISFADDDWRECKDYVRQRLGLCQFTPTDPPPAPVIVTSATEDRVRVERASSLWREACPIDGTPAAIYLARRGVSYALATSGANRAMCFISHSRIYLASSLSKNLSTSGAISSFPGTATENFPPPGNPTFLFLQVEPQVVR